MPLSSVHLLISGKVQGVGYRAFAKKKAKTYIINGWVRNISDGRVEILATCNDFNFHQYLNDLYIGPPAAKVNEIIVNKNFDLIEFNSFVMKNTSSRTWGEGDL